MSRVVKQRWEADLSAFGGRKARASFSYEAHVPDFIAALELSLPSDIAQVVTEAEVAVRRLNDGPEVPVLETLARQLLRAESVASSRIEGLQLSQRRLAKAAYTDDASDVTAQSVLANMRAMELAVARGARQRPFVVKDILALHRELFGAFGDPTAGRVRTEQNWVGGAASSPRDAEFVPPPPQLVPELLADLCSYLNRDDVPAVAQAAIVHAQFETIHPFADGNGRVGRCLIHVVLRRRGVAHRFVPPVSLILATDSKRYVAGLGDYRRDEVAQWCGLFAQATRTSAIEATRFSSHIEALKSRWRAAAKLPRPHSAASALIEFLPSHPILNVSAAQTLLARSNQAARLAMMQLERAGVVKQLSVGRRNRAWEATGLFELINAFESRLAAWRGR